MFWELTDDDILSAQAGDVRATQRVYAVAMPTCERMALALCGSRDAAARVLHGLVQRSAGQMSVWRSADEAGRWFMHHTVLLTREHAPAHVVDEALLHGVGGPDVVAYGAMIYALRKLPQQQREAFILTHAQRWNTRLCAVAMDCSNRAVETHLIEANKKIQSLTGEHFDALTSALRTVYTTLPLDVPLPPGTLARRIHRGRSMRRLLRLLIPAAAIVFLLIALFILLYIVPRVDM
jgi:hypothetical protein